MCTYLVRETNVISVWHVFHLLSKCIINKNVNMHFMDFVTHFYLLWRSKHSCHLTHQALAQLINKSKWHYYSLQLAA